MIQLRKCWRKLFFIILSISLIFIIYQLYYYRLLVNVTNNISTSKSSSSSSRRIVGPSASLFIGQQHNNDPIMIDDLQIRSPDHDGNGIVNIPNVIIGIDNNAHDNMDQYRRAFQYQNGYFHCINTNDQIILIDRKYFNDDYCDCPDGSDEPSTSACSALLSSSTKSNEPLMFHCHSSSSSSSPCRIVSIPYYRVNDG